MALWLKDHMMSIGFHTLGSWKFLVKHCLIGDRTGPLGGEWMTVGWEGWGECCEKSAPPRL
jgi:hypothetical protein